MSTSTLDAIDAAIRDHMAQEHEGQLVIGWAIVTATTSPDDDANLYDTIAPEWQPAHSTLGLMRLGDDLMLNGGDDE